jgi:acetyltransferase-like isoleucine patch superfamily enzyme
MQHPAVAQAVAFAIPHATLGEDVAAAIVLNPNTTVTESEIRDFAADRLAAYKVPCRVLIVEEIPKGPTGKLQRIGLADKLGLKLQHGFVASRIPVEKQLTEIWRDLLHADQVGVSDSFYLLGGDSLTAATMITEIENRFNTSIAVDDFLRSPTIETITTLLQEKCSSPSPASVVAGRINEYKPIRDSFWIGLKNRLLQTVSLYAPGYKTTRIMLHRMRGVSIGNDVSIGLSVIIETAYPSLVFIGNNVTIGIRTIIIGHHRGFTAQAIDTGQHTVRIEDNVYIGPGVIILPNVTIGHGAVVSAGSVVSRSVPPQTLVQGNPAKPIAHCGMPLGAGNTYEQFLHHLTPIKDNQPS